MERYDYQSRKLLFEEYSNKFFKKSLLQSIFSDKKTNEVIAEMEKLASNSDSIPIIKNASSSMTGGTFDSPSKFMKTEYKKLVKIFTTIENSEEYYYIIDRFNQFTYSSGISRRSVRSSSYEHWMITVFRLLYDYFLFSFYECSLSQYLKNEMPENKLDYKQNCFYNYRLMHLDDMIAAKIDLGDITLKNTIKDIILSENNTSIVTPEMIRGVIKSSDEELHKLLGDFLLAAKLQEGIRQVICENMDCGTKKAFLLLFDVIYENNLVRFSSVKRAISTWVGICDESNLDRITSKMLAHMKECLYNSQKSLEYTHSNDSIEIIIALWALGFYEVMDAIDVMQRFTDEGTRNQKLTMSYYNLAFENPDLSGVTAKKILEKYCDDYEMVAAFMPTYLSYTDSYADLIIDTNKDTKTYKTIPITHLFQDTKEAAKHFYIMRNIYEMLPQKKLEFKPSIFPWYSTFLSKTQLIKRMSLIAYSLGDSEMIDYTAGQLSCIDITENYSNRSLYLEILLHNPKTEIQKELLVNYIADKESSTRSTAYSIIKDLTLEEKYYLVLESMLKYKTSDIRKNVIELLLLQKGEALISSITRLLKEEKEAIRTGGLDIVLQLKRESTRKKEYEKGSKLVEEITNPTSMEQILINEIYGNTKASEILNHKGYGLYDPLAACELSLPSIDVTILKRYFDIPTETLNNILDKLDTFLQKHEHLEYKDSTGEERLLGNGLWRTTYDFAIPYEDTMPFKELWVEFYQEEIKNYKTLINLYLAVNKGLDGIKNLTMLQKQEELLLGKNILKVVFDGDGHRTLNKSALRSLIPTILTILLHIYDNRKHTRELSKAIFQVIIETFPAQALWYEYNEDYYYAPRYASFMEVNEISIFKETLLNWETEEEFAESFILLRMMDKKLLYPFPEKNQEPYYLKESKKLLNILDYVKAYEIKLISADIVYKGIFEDVGLYEALKLLSYFSKDKLRSHEANLLKKYGVEEVSDITNPFFSSGASFYQKVVDKILDVELKRGDTPTVFSSSIQGISCLYGVDRLVEILTALGKDSLDRSTYYWSRNDSRKSCLSYLLKVSYPREEDNANKLSVSLKGSGITVQRLIETSLYAPQWMDIIGEYLGIIGLKSGCYYFMAHMNEHFDDKKQSMIAKYTPITPESLNNGAFDLNWFKEAYTLLGEKNFTMIYKAAKYISDGSKHARARKYADAALGKITIQELETAILDKRNKDLLMSYGLIAIQDKKDLLHRYEFLQQFLKESKQFGAARKASEALAVKIALENLALAAGFTDITRLILMMETELIKSYAPLLDWKEIEDFALRLQVDDLGQVHVEVKKKDKLLSSIPSALKKEDYVAALKATQKKLKEQYLRTKQMFEEAMENSVVFTTEELIELLKNPVVNPIVSSLVYSTEGNIPVSLGFLSSNGLLSYTGEVQPIDGKTLLRIAHPSDLYKAGCWHAFQQYLFNEVVAEKRKKQPFKQVFRELYLKLEDELDKTHSLLFAGNQIQPQRTVGCLKSRKWIADYEEGLQKIYYKENIVCRIYALADWFSPSDVEAPTLEWVEFSDRKSFKTLTIKKIPDIIYSEVMRDVDLAVSVAHAGGVDPETSHSTIEMRKTIIEFNLPLFSLDNIVLEGNHALITGKRASYSIHLGSGIIHKMGGPMLNVLPVHSQSRGKLFLPFIDEDPKTAEIMSKIVLFSRDEKIKDPYILNQY